MRMQRIGVMLAMPLLAGSGVATLSGGAASAAVIPAAITSVSTSQSQVGQWDQVVFDCTWKVPNRRSALLGRVIWVICWGVLRPC
jgi:surface antigen